MIAGMPAERRAAMLRNLTHLFADYAPRIGRSQVAAFDIVLLQLAEDLDEDARSELSTRIAAIANAPPTLVRNLAFDPAAAVALPVLEHALVLSDGDIAAIARACAQTHLGAIARRAILAEPVTDIVVERADREVMRVVARNAGARFSLGGYQRLVGKGLSDPDLSVTIQGRGDLPAIFRRDAPVSPAIQPGPRPDAAIFAAEVFVGGQARRGDLDEAVLVGWLNSGRETEALVGLARIAGVPSQVAIDAYRADTYEPLLYLVRSVRFGWRILKLFMASKAEREAPPEVMQGMMEAFQALSVATAQRVVRATAARSRVQGGTP